MNTLTKVGSILSFGLHILNIKVGLPLKRYFAPHMEDQKLDASDIAWLVGYPLVILFIVLFTVL